MQGELRRSICRNDSLAGDEQAVKLRAKGRHTLGDARRGGVHHRRVERVGLAPQVRGPPVHLRRGEFGLPARPASYAA